MLYVVSGRLNSREFAFASLLDRPVVPVVMAILYSKDILPGPLALAFSFSDFGGFLWTLASWRNDIRYGQRPDRPSLLAGLAAWFFSFTSGVVRNSRTFHPDGRVFRGTVQSLGPASSSLSRAAAKLEGAVLLRIGMGLMKRGWPRWLADHIPDAPSIAARFYTPSAPDDIRLERRLDEDLDLLSTAGSDRLWKLVLNLAGRFGLRPAPVRLPECLPRTSYLVDDGTLGCGCIGRTRHNQPLARRLARKVLTTVARRATIRVEAQRTGSPREPFVPIAEMR